MIDSAPIPYMQRTRDYYLALEYNNPYRWARHESIPFTPLRKALSECRMGLVVTAAPFRSECGDQGAGAPYNSGAKFYEVLALSSTGEPDLRISHIGYDRLHTTAGDINSYFPLAQLKTALAEGVIGGIAERFICLPTDRSQDKTNQVYAPEILEYLREDGVDAVLLVPNCPICHQSVSLVARFLESRGLPTVISGCAKDVVEHCGVPRFLFNDFPLGNGAGKEHAPGSQRETLALALDLLATATAPGTTVQNPQQWSADHGWKKDFCNLENLTPEKIKARKAAAEEQRIIARNIRISGVHS